MQLKTENYKGYAVKFVDKIIGSNPNVSVSTSKIVQGTFKSKVTGKILGDSGLSKAEAMTRVKRMIDREIKFNK